MDRETTDQSLAMGARISVAEASCRMGVTPQFLRMGLRTGKFPFGTAIRMEKRWAYYINAKRFELYMAGEDMKGAAFS